MTKGITSGAAFRAAVADEFEDADAGQAVLLDRACALLDRLERAERRLDQDGLVVVGGNGQQVAHPLIATTRQDSLALAKIIDVLFPDPKAETPSERAARAARARWGR